MQLTPTVKQLLIINVMVFIGCMFIPKAEALFALFYFENPNFRLWQPLTHMFMHGGIMHIAFNMFALVSFGSLLEQFWGGHKFLFFYISCGLGAFLLHTGVNYYFYHEGIQHLQSLGLEAQIPEFLQTRRLNFNVRPAGLDEGILQNMLDAYNNPAVGASGAIYGLLTAFAFMFPNAELMMIFIPVPIKAKYFVPGLILLDLFSGVSGSALMGGNIAHFAHVGGALTGFIMMWFWKKDQFRHNRWN